MGSDLIPPSHDLEPVTVLDRARSNFRLGFVCLDAERRAGMTAIYAFCRVADDAADDTPDVETGTAHLAYWRAELQAAEVGKAVTPVGRALGRVMQRFDMSPEPLEALLDGCAMDLEPRAFGELDDLRLYCDRVASAVGRACLPVLGASGADAVRFADRLGQALQFTNILRDLAGDAAVGRTYVPRRWLAETGVEPAWLDGGGPAEAYHHDGPVALLRGRFVTTARADFAAAREALLALPRSMRRSLVSARIMGAIYGDLLRRLAARGGRIDRERVRVPRAKKLWLAALVLGGVRA